MRQNDTSAKQKRLHYFHILHLWFASCELDGHLEVDEVAVDVERDGFALLRIVVKFETNVGTAEIVFFRTN